MEIRIGRQPEKEQKPEAPTRPEVYKWRELWIHSSGEELHRIVEALRKQGIKVKTWREVAKLM